MLIQMVANLNSCFQGIQTMLHQLDGTYMHQQIQTTGNLHLYNFTYNQQHKLNTYKSEPTHTTTPTHPPTQQHNNIMGHQEIFQASICGYDVRIILNSEGLIIFLWNPQRRRYYESKIASEYVGKSKEIQDIFTNIDQFYVYLTQYSEDYQRVSIDEHGKIKVTYYLSIKSKTQSPPSLLIETQILLAGHQIKNEKKLHSDVSDIKRQNIKLQDKISKLQKLNEENKSVLGQIKALLEKKNRRYHQPSESDSPSHSDDDRNHQKKKNKKKRKKFSVISGGKSGILELNTTVKEVAGELAAIKDEMMKKQQRSKKKSMYLGLIAKSNLCGQESAIFGQKIIITVDTNNKFLQREYRVEGNLITKIRGYGRFQLLSKEVIPSVGKHYFAIFIEHISYKIFSLGIVSQKRRNYPNSHLSPQLISYFAKTGAIWEKGDCRGGGPQIPNGVQIRVVVDMSRWSVRWFMDGKEMACTVIGEQLRGQRLVAYLQFNYQNDRVYWNQRRSVGQ